MADKGQKEKHKCPPEPWPKPNVLYAPSYNGENFAVAKSMWEAHRKRIMRLTPMPRNSNQ